MFLNKVKMAGAIALVLSSGAVVLGYQIASQGESPRKKAAPATRSSPIAEKVAVEDWVAGWPDLTAPGQQSFKTKAILGALDESISMNFPNETPLMDVIKYIKAATERPGLPKGIPIYVDPQGLQSADKTMASTVEIDLEGVALSTTLELALKQLNLMYRVKDGVLIIHSIGPEDQVTTLTILEEKAMRGELTRVQYQQFIEMLKLRNEVSGLIDESGL